MLLQQTGTMHLMAISGLHISIAARIGVLVAKMILWFIPRILLTLPARSFQLSLAVPLALFYALMAGMPICAQRALIMLICILLLELLRQNTSAWTSLVFAVFAVFAVLLIDPLAILAAGFWLSFFAVGMLCYLLQQGSTAMPATANEESLNQSNNSSQEPGSEVGKTRQKKKLR